MTAELLRHGGHAIIPIMAVVFIATFIRSAFGFGEALVAVPLLALLMPVSVAAPLAMLVSITVAGVVVIQDHSDLDLRSAGWLVVFTLPGIPLGLLLLKSVAEPVVKGALACVVIAFAFYSLFSARPRELHDDRLAWLFGFSAGVLGGAYGMNGPPLVVYGSLRRWSPRRFRATLQGYFLPASLLGAVGYWFVGLWTPVVSHYYLWSLPAVALAIVLGRVVNRRMPGHRFLRWVNVGLVATGIVLLLQSQANILYPGHHQSRAVAHPRVNRQPARGSPEYQ